MLAINKNQLRARSWFSRQQRCVELRQYKHGTKGILTIFVYQHGCEASEPGMRHPARLGRRVRRASCSDALLEESQSKSGNAAMPRIYHRKSACTHHSAACSDARSPRLSFGRCGREKICAPPKRLRHRCWGCRRRVVRHAVVHTPV